MVNLMVILPVGCLAMLWWLLCAPSGGRRLAVILASAAWMAYLVLLTETLTLAGQISFGPLTAGWSALFLTLATAIAVRRPSFPRLPRIWREYTPIIGIVVATVLLLLAIAIAAPPNTWDSMTYHMARVAHWVQNESVAPYATSNPRQIHLGPGAEYIILHLQVLTGGDVWANCVQWFALVGCMAAASLIARGLRAGPAGQVWAGALCVAIPMAVCQATSTQNDLVVAFWLMGFAAIGFELCVVQSTPRNVALATAMGLHLGFAFLTKATASLMAPPLALIFFVLAPCGVRGRAWVVATVLLAGSMVNAGFLARNYQASGHVLGPRAEFYNGDVLTYVNEKITPAHVASNVMRNLALELLLPFEGWNTELIGWVRHAHTPMGILANERETTFAYTRFSTGGVIVGLNREDTAPAPLVVVAIGVAFAATILFRGQAWGLRATYGLSVFVAYVLFCAVLKWQPWHARLHLPMLLLACPLVAVAIEQYASPRLQPWLVGFLLLGGMPCVFNNHSKPVFGSDGVFRASRESQYFANNRGLRAGFETVARAYAESPAAHVGLAYPEDGWEYPMVRLLRRVNPGVRIDHVGVRNYTRKFETARKPGVVVKVDYEGKAELLRPSR